MLSEWLVQKLNNISIFGEIEQTTTKYFSYTNWSLLGRMHVLGKNPFVKIKRMSKMRNLLYQWIQFMQSFWYNYWLFLNWFLLHFHWFLTYMDIYKVHYQYPFNHIILYKLKCTCVHSSPQNYIEKTYGCITLEHHFSYDHWR